MQSTYKYRVEFNITMNVGEFVIRKMSFKADLACVYSRLVFQ